MTKVTFETAGLAAALKEASVVAPSRGEAFDKAAGILLDVQRDAVVVKATDLRLRYMQWVTPLEVEGDPVKWRFSSKVFSEVITKLDLDNNKRLVLQQDGNVVKMTHHRKRGQFNLMDAEIYPEWMPFDPDDLTDVTDMAVRIGQVEWAASKGTDVPYIGIHFDGALVMATDRYRFAVTPLEINGLEKPVTVPAGLLGQIVKPTDAVKVRAEPNGLLLMPDDHTQVECVIYGMDYPPIMRVVTRDYPQMVTVQKASLLSMMQVAVSFAGNDRAPIMRVFFGNEEIAVMMANQETGLLGDILDVPGQAKHPRMEVRFSPKNIMDAIEHSPNQEITFGYNPERPTGAFYIKAGGGCDFWISPLKNDDA